MRGSFRRKLTTPLEKHYSGSNAVAQIRPRKCCVQILLFKRKILRGCKSACQGTKLLFRCVNTCFNNTRNGIDRKTHEKNQYQINNLVVLGMRAIGKG